MELSDLLEPMRKSSILVQYDAHPGANSPIGASKIGGQPDLPAGFEWPYFEGTAYDGVTANRPLSFLAQINCAEASKYDNDSMLPSSGMLYFFYELLTMTSGYGPQDKGSSRVYYFGGGTSDLHRTDFPDDLLPDCRIPAMPVTFSSRTELPDFEELAEWRDDVDWDDYQEYNETRATIVEEPDPDEISKLLGYANLIQGGMLKQCELVSGGTDLTPDAYYEYSLATTEQQLRHDCARWQLLFQIDSIETPKYSLSWISYGRLYFYIDHAAPVRGIFAPWTLRIYWNQW